MAEKVLKHGLGGHAIAGLLWGVLGGITGKLAGFLAQIYLGWVLSPEDFALYAIALAFAAMLAGLVNGGTQRILIQRSARYEELAFVVLKIAFLFNLAVMLSLGSLAFPVAHWFDASVLAPMLAIMGLATLLSTPGYILHAKLLGELRFGVVQGLAISSHAARHGSTVFFAFLGLGPLSFVLPLLVIAVTDNLLAWRVVRQLPTPRKLDRHAAWDVLKDSRWIMTGAFAGALIQNGSNLVVGLVAGKATLGFYFFAFQLTFAVASLIGGTLQSVIMPTLACIADDPLRQRQAFKRSISVTALGASAMAMVLVIVAPPLVHRLWAGKWDEAIVVVQVLALAIPALLVSWIARGSIEACGGWAVVTVLSVAEGIGTVAAATAGALVGGLPTIAASVMIFKVLAGFVHVIVAAKYLGGTAGDAAQFLLTSYVAGVVALGAGYVVATGHAIPSQSELGDSALVATVFAVVFILLALMLCRTGAAELRMIAGHLRSRLSGTSTDHPS